MLRSTVKGKTMPKYHVSGAGGDRIVTAKDETEAKHLAMVERWGDVSDRVVPRAIDPKTGKLQPYTDVTECPGLTVKQIK